MESLDQFSPREKAVIELLLQGKSNKQIAFMLRLTPRTIEYHLTNIYNKLGVSSRSGAIILLTKSLSNSTDSQEINQLRESAIGLRQSTVVPPTEVHDNKARLSFGRQLMESKKFIFTGIGLLAFLSIAYLFLANLITGDQQQTVRNTVYPEKSLVSSPSPNDTQPESISDEQLGLQVLVDFLSYLNQGEYKKAAALYGGSYETMTAQNPDVDPADHETVLKNACTINGMQCLQVNSAGPTSAGPYETNELNNRSEFKYQVEFINHDGSLYILGPCCGGNATDSPPQSVFYFSVVKVEDDKFLVMDMPPYSP